MGMKNIAHINFNLPPLWVRPQRIMANVEWTGTMVYGIFSTAIKNVSDSIISTNRHSWVQR